MCSSDAADEGALALEAPSSPVEADFISPVAQDNDDAMAVDEESRPKFAPARDIVCSTTWLVASSATTVANVSSLGSRHKSRDPQSAHPTTPNDPAEAKLDVHLSAPRRAPEVAMPDEHQAEDGRAAHI